MRKEAYSIDEQGFAIDKYLTFVDSKGNVLSYENELGEIVPVSTETFVTTVFESELIKPKWSGIGWVEGASEDEKAERNSQQLLESLKPSPEELANAELEIKILTMLTDLEVVQ